MISLFQDNLTVEILLNFYRQGRLGMKLKRN